MMTTTEEVFEIYVDLATRVARVNELLKDLTMRVIEDPLLLGPAHQRVLVDIGDILTDDAMFAIPESPEHMLALMRGNEQVYAGILQRLAFLYVANGWDLP